MKTLIMQKEMKLVLSLSRDIITDIETYLNA